MPAFINYVFVVSTNFLACLHNCSLLVFLVYSLIYFIFLKQILQSYWSCHVFCGLLYSLTCFDEQILHNKFFSFFTAWWPPTYILRPFEFSTFLRVPVWVSLFSFSFFNLTPQIDLELGLIVFTISLKKTKLVSKCKNWLCSSILTKS